MIESNRRQWRLPSLAERRVHDISKCKTWTSSSSYNAKIRASTWKSCVNTNNSSLCRQCCSIGFPLVSRKKGLLCLKTESAGDPSALKDWIGWWPNRVEILNRLVPQPCVKTKSAGAPSWPQLCLKIESAGDPTVFKDWIGWCPSRV